MIFKMVVTNLGEETVTVPAGTFRCYKLAMEINEWWRFFVFGLDDNYFWVQKDPPYLFVKWTYPFAGYHKELVAYSMEK